MIIRCLSVREPYVTNIESGEKRIELRTWPIPPGPLVIASTAAGKQSGVQRCLVNVVECRPATAEDADAACYHAPDRETSGWFNGLYAVVLAPCVQRLKQKPIKGRQRLYDADAEPETIYLYRCLEPRLLGPWSEYACHDCGISWWASGVADERPCQKCGI